MILSFFLAAIKNVFEISCRKIRTGNSRARKFFFSFNYSWQQYTMKNIINLFQYQRKSSVSLQLLTFIWHNNKYKVMVWRKKGEKSYFTSIVVKVLVGWKINVIKLIYNQLNCICFHHFYLFGIFNSHDACSGHSNQVAYRFY